MGRKVLYLLSFGLLIGVLLLSLEVYADRKAKERVESFVNRLNLEGRVSYRSVDHSLIKGETRIRDLSLFTEKGRVKVEEVIISRLTEKETKVRFLGITSTDEEFGEFRERMRELGYEDVKMNLYVDVMTDREKGDLKVRTFRVEVPEAFTFDLKVDLGNVSYEDLPEITEEVGRVRIRSFEVSFTDLGIMERAIMKEAEEKNTTAERVKEEILRELERSVRESDPEIKKEIVAKLKAFVERGGTIRLSARPDRPVNVSDLVLVFLVSAQTKDLSQVVNMLNLNVEHRQ